MGKIVVTTNVSLDGIVQDPDGQEGFKHGGWFGQFGGQDLEGWARVETEEALQSEAILLGRNSDEWFATRWLNRTGEWADQLNSLPKYIVSSTLVKPKWTNSTVLKDDVVRELIDGVAGMRTAGDNMPAGDQAWWQDYRDRVAEAAASAADS